MCPDDLLASYTGLGVRGQRSADMIMILCVRVQAIGQSRHIQGLSRQSFSQRVRARI